MRYHKNGTYKYDREDKVTIKEGNEAQEAYIPILDFFLRVQSSLVETLDVLQTKNPDKLSLLHGLHVKHDRNKAALESENSQGALLSDIISLDLQYAR